MTTWIGAAVRGSQKPSRSDVDPVATSPFAACHCTDVRSYPKLERLRSFSWERRSQIAGWASVAAPTSFSPVGATDKARIEWPMKSWQGNSQRGHNQTIPYLHNGQWRQSCSAEMDSTAPVSDGSSLSIWCPVTGRQSTRAILDAYRTHSVGDRLPGAVSRLRGKSCARPKRSVPRRLWLPCSGVHQETTE